MLYLSLLDQKMINVTNEISAVEVAVNLEKFEHGVKKKQEVVISRSLISYLS